MFPDKPYLYGLFALCGAAAAVFAFEFLMRREGVCAAARKGFMRLALFSILCGLVSAVAFQLLYDLFARGFAVFKMYSDGEASLGLTFLGGLAGGAAAFFAGARLSRSERKFLKNPAIKDNFAAALRAAPAPVALGHFFGRIGCFCAGCCYGIRTDGFPGMLFPAGSEASLDINGGAEAVRVLPTQLFEAVFLLALFFICLKFPRRSLVIYLTAYGAFRFVIEFFRGDPRGALFWQSVLSPSQILSLVMAGAGGVIIYKSRRENLKAA